MALGEQMGLGYRQATFGLRDLAAELFGGLDPFLDDDLEVGESFLIRRTVRGAAAATPGLQRKKRCLPRSIR
jgi:hypothetical protein